MIFDGPLLGITGDGRPMSRTRVNEILAECKDFESVESPGLPVGEKPPAVMDVRGDIVVVCAWHEGGRGKLEAHRWAFAQGFTKISHGQCPHCAAAVKDGTWKKLT